MNLTFYKYQGTGNDFVIIDNRQSIFDKNDTNLVARMCDRRFGIGADGLILLENHPEVDFKMVYFNADGRESSMCGNGARCIVHFANYLGIINDTTEFLAVDGLHEAKIAENEVALKMQHVDEVEVITEGVRLNTGSPHLICEQRNLGGLNVDHEGAAIRYGEEYKDEGINVNFVAISDNKDLVEVRTYERGVEAETLSCGTGVTAVALGLHYTKKIESNDVAIKTQGGLLRVTFETSENGYDNIWLIGPAVQVFKGNYAW